VELAGEVAHLFALGLEVTLVGGHGGYVGGDGLDDFDFGEFFGRGDSKGRRIREFVAAKFKCPRPPLNTTS
jgi:hypothetical protein